MLMLRPIAITGPIGTGATTLAKRLVEVVPTWETFFESDVERTNPFFSRYHVDPAHYTFHNQVTFLTSSAEYHCHLRNLARPGKVYVQDFSPFEHTEVYAYVQYHFGLLSRDEYQMLRRLTKVIEPSFLKPSILVYRPLNKEQLRQRVQKRGRPDEELLDDSFLDSIRQRFDEWATTWSRSPMIRVDEKLDVLADTEAVRRLGKIILEKLSNA